jgi:hypothetical protein
MAQSLPPRANLEHLRNEAKQRLKTMQAQDPGARLAAAQLAIAREYGFASWRRLKAAVDEQDRERPAARARATPTRSVALDGGFNPARPRDGPDHLHQIANSGPHRPRAVHAPAPGARRRHDDQAPCGPSEAAAAEGGPWEATGWRPDLIDAIRLTLEQQNRAAQGGVENRLECVRVPLSTAPTSAFATSTPILHFAVAEADLNRQDAGRGGLDVVGGATTNTGGTGLGDARAASARTPRISARRCALNIWSAIALGAPTTCAPSFGPSRILSARMTRRHGRTPPHHGGDESARRSCACF